MRFNAKTENWISMEIRGVSGFFSDMRIDRETVPEQFHFWELADADSDGIPCRYRPGIMVNFFGTFITTGVLPVDFQEHQEGWIEDNEWGFTGEEYISFQEVLEITNN